MARNQKQQPHSNPTDNAIRSRNTGAYGPKRARYDDGPYQRLYHHNPPLDCTASNQASTSIECTQTFLPTEGNQVQQEQNHYHDDLNPINLSNDYVQCHQTFRTERNRSIPQRNFQTPNQKNEQSSRLVNARNEIPQSDFGCFGKEDILYVSGEIQQEERQQATTRSCVGDNPTDNLDSKPPFDSSLKIRTKTGREAQSSYLKVSETVTKNNNSDEHQKLRTNWDTYTKEEQMKILFPIETAMKIPQLNVPRDYKERQQRGVKAATEYLRKKLQRNYEPTQEEPPSDDASCNNNQSSDDDDDFRVCCKQTDDQKQLEIKMYTTFIDALPYCTPLDLGYLAKNTYLDADQCCWCPCQKNKFANWREIFTINKRIGDVEITCDSTKYKPNGLRKHLAAKRSIPNTNDDNNDQYIHSLLHDLVYVYLTDVYKNYTLVRSKNKWLNHSGHYEPLSTNCREATAAQLDDLNIQIQEMKEHSKMHEQTIIEQLKMKHLLRLEKTKAKKKQKRKIYEFLKLDDSKIESKLEVDAIQLNVYDERRKKFFDLCEKEALYDFYENRKRIKKSYTQKEFHLQKQQPKLRRHGLEITVPQKFVLSEMLTEWIESQCELAMDLDETNRYQWLNLWSVNFTSAIKVENVDDITAIDDGGPTRAFLSEIWSQIRGLEVSLDGYSVELFNEHGVPNRNDYIVTKLRAKEALTEAEDLVRSRCRILGRFMLYCIAMSGRTPVTTINKHEPRNLILASHVLPEVYRYYYFKDIDPRNPEYPIENLANDVVTIMFPMEYQMKSYDKMQMYVEAISNSNINSPDALRSRFREVAKRDLLEDRSWAVEAIKEGLTLGGRILLSLAFSAFPQHYIDVMLFATADVSADDLINILVVQYDEVESNSLSVQHQKSILSLREDGTREGYLPDLLRREDAAFCARFLEFVTGSSFVPKFKADYKITIEFNFVESMSEDSLTVSHTCVNTLKLPGLAYDGKREIFELKLKQSMELSEAFDMA